ncbi:hypothetical protein L208DRAFT_1382060 [Tricholoma matsutake]|nr:hypothetical protein L208DRAFT_1382060 [Tricholoma matsutake 945]
MRRLMDIDIPISPTLLPCTTTILPEQSTSGIIQPPIAAPLLPPFTQSATRTGSDRDTLIASAWDEKGLLNATGHEFHESLEAIKQKKPLQDMLNSCEVWFLKSATLEQLRDTLVNYWYPDFIDEPQADSLPPTVNLSCPLALNMMPNVHHPPICHLAHALGHISLEDNDEMLLINEFDVDGANADEECVQRPLRKNEIKNPIVDEDSLLALWICKEQEVKDPGLAHKHLATSIIVWNAIKNRMDEALERVRNGLMPDEDAPDIIANTFLMEVMQEQLDEIGLGFLQHWELQSVCGAAIFELCPKSALFKLPALANQEVQTWMKTTFWTELSALQAAAGSSVYLAWIQNEALWQALEENWCLQQDQKLQMEKLIQMLQQQTVSQVDLVLPPAAAFTQPGIQILRAVGPWLATNPQAEIHSLGPELLLECWKPLKSLDQYDLEGLWEYTLGEWVCDAADVQTGVKLPLHLVEQYFQSKWHNTSTTIPEWIHSQSISCHVSPKIVIDELKKMHHTLDGKCKGLNALMKEVKKLHFEMSQQLQDFHRNLALYHLLCPVFDVKKKCRAPPLDPQRKRKKPA